MKFSSLIQLVSLASMGASMPAKRSINETVESNSTNNDLQTSYGKPFALFQPKVMITSMFELERDPWLEALDFVHNLTIPGLSPVYPEIHCTTNYSICQFTTGEGEINAAASVTALTLSPLFDLSKTYWLIAGIAGGEPDYTTIGSVTFAKYAIQGGLEYEIDWREVKETNPEWNTTYFSYGTDNPWTYPANVYGSEVFEVNEDLRNHAAELASKVKLDVGTKQNAHFRTLYDQKKASSKPAVEKCDVLTSDVYYSGNLLSDYFANLTKLMTNGSATYCSSAQEDNASLEAIVRMTDHGLADFDRVVVMRTISDFTRPPQSMTNDSVGFFTKANQGGIEASLSNLVNAGFPFVHDVVQNWESTYEKGFKYKPSNYIGDIFGTLGGTPNFGKKSFEIA